MALTVQNLRAVGTGVEPASLLPGQIAFNITDKVLYVGDGSNVKTAFDGTQAAGVPGEGWYAMPMDFESLGEYYVANPQFYGDTPTDQQVLTWSDAYNHPIWTSGGGGGGNQVYVTDNATVAAASGTTVSDKITTAIGVASPDEGDVTIVTGLPDDVYEGLYFFTTEWVKGAAYAYPSASEVIYDNTAHPDLTPTVQGAISDLDDGLTATTAIANTANSTATSALSIANAALPKAGGTMTGTIVARNINVQTSYFLQFNGGADGQIFGITDSKVFSSSTTAASAKAVADTYAVAAAALPVAGGIMTGPITFAAGQIFPVSGIQDATYIQKGVVQVGNNIDVLGGVISVKTATSANLGLVQTGTNIQNSSGVISVLTGSASQKGVLQVGTNLDVAAGVISVADATTSNKGVVQLNDAVNSTSILQAATANAVKTTYELADAAVPRSSYTADGDILVGTAPGTFGALSVGTEGQILTVQGGVPTWTDDAPGDVTSVTGTAPIVVDNFDPENPVVSVDAATTATLGVVQIDLTGNINVAGGVITVPNASTTIRGAVQLNNTLSSTSTTEALTAAQGKALQDQISTLNLTNSVILAGGYDATTGLVDGVTAQGTAAGFVDGAVPPAASSGNVDHYLICTTAGTNPSAMENGDWLLSSETSPGVYAYVVLGVGARPATASYTQAGVVQLADGAAVLAGTSDATAITPQALQDNVIDSVTTSNSNLIASATAVKTANDNALTAQTLANNAQATANAALPKAGGTMTGTISAHDVNIQTGFAVQFAGGVNGSLDGITDSTSTTDSTVAASATAVKSAYDLANAALPQTGGTVTGDITLSGAGIGIVFDDASTVEAISDSVSTTSSVTAASSTAAKSAYDLATTANNTANAALPVSGGTMTGAITFAAGQIFPVSGIQDATTGQKGVVQVGTNIQVSSGTISVNTATTGQLGLVQVGSNIQVSSGTISVQNASTTQSGVVQLNDTVASTSTTQALTANQGYQLQQQINALSTSNNVTFAGTFNAATSQMVTVTVEGAAVGFVVGAGLPSPSTAIAEYFVIVSTAGTTTPPGGVPVAANVGDWFLASASSWTYIAAGYLPPAASTTTPGIVELATDAETQAGTNSTNAVVPSALQSKMSDSVATSSSTTIASSTAVKSAYDLANAAVPSSCYTALGALTVGTGLGTVGTLSVGTNGQFLAANSACSGGLQWCTISLACVPCSAFTGAGVLLSGTGAGTFSALPAGTSGQFLVADTACANGVKWCTSAAASICGFTCTLTPFNTALGGLAGAALTGLSVANTAIGYAALDSETTGDFNTAVGHNALTAQNGPTGNTAVGGNAGAQIVGGACNTIMGYNAADALTTGSNNVAIGFNSLGTAISGTNNVAVGMNALALSTTGCQVAVGYCALASNGTGVSNTAVGYFSLSQLLAGSQNTAVGFGTGQVLSGQSNTLIGYNAGNSVTTASGNTLVGCSAGTGITTQDGHVAIGSQTLVGVLDINNRNLVAVGTCALRAVTTGLNNIGIGFCAGTAITTGGCNIAIGAGALDSVTTTANNIGVGFSALTSITSGSENIAIGTCAGVAVTTGTDVVAIGHNAAFTQSTGSQSVHIGTCAGRSANAVGVTTIGFCAGQASTTAGCITYLGWTAGRNATGTNNTYVGALTGCAASNTSACGTLLGFCAGSAITTGNGNSLIGFQAGRFVTTGASNVALGSAALQTATTGSSNIAIGCGALANVGTTSGNTAVGHRAGLNATGSNNVVVGCEAGSQLSTGSTNVLIGNTAGDAVTSGSNNTIIGDVAGSAALADNLILAAGTTIKLQVNENGAVGVGATPSYGTAGQVLQSAGTAAAPTWTTPVWQPLTTLTTTSTTSTTLLSVPVASTRAVFIDLSVSDATGGNYHTDSYQVVTDGTTTNDQQIAGARLGTSPYTLTSAVVGANLVVSVTSASTNSTKYVGSYQTFAI